MRQEGDQSLALTRDVNLDTQSSDISAEKIRESGRSFQSNFGLSVQLHLKFKDLLNL